GGAAATRGCREEERGRIRMRSQHPLAGGRVSGNRGVSRPLILVAGGDLSGARDEAIPKEGGSWGETWFPPRERSEAGGDAARATRGCREEERGRTRMRSQHLRDVDVRAKERRGAPAAV